MGEGVLCRDAPGGLEGEHLVDEICRRGVNPRKVFEDAPAIGGARGREVQLCIVGQGGDSRHHLGRDGAAQLADALDLVEVRVAGEKGLFEVHLGEDASGAPHVHRRGILGGAEEQLWRAVPARDDAGRVLAAALLEVPGEAKVCEAQLSPVVDEDV